MTFAFLAPLFLAGMTLLAVPWYLHHIRRPEREPIRFSSVLFIPQAKKEVIERRRLQHIILMLIRMLILAVLVFAFARPCIKLLSAVAQPGGTARHVILLDTSYSMGTLDWFSRAKREALDIVENVGRGGRVGVIAFARTPLVLAPLFSDDQPAGDRDQARRAIEAARLTEESTDFVSALQLAQELLVADFGPSDQLPGQLIVHLVSDFQKQGMPDRAPGWKLSRRITLHPVEVGVPEVPNYSIIDLSIRDTDNDNIRIRGKLKNWSHEEERSVEVRLVVNGTATAANTLSVKPRNASQASFILATPQDQIVEGWIEVEDNTLDVDNRRYFSRNPVRKRRVLVVADDRPEKRWPAASLLTHAVPEQADLPWTLSQVQQTDLAGRLGRDDTRPDVLVTGDLAGIDPDFAQTVIEYVRDGGGMFLVLGGTMSPAGLNRSLLPALGMRDTGFRHKQSDETQFDLISWVDFDHALFFPFRGSRFNDFSHIRFFNYHCLEPIGSGETPPRVLARFEAADASDAGHDSGLPAIVEAELGKGRVILWTFGIDLDWSSLPKSPRFVPMVHETLSYFTGRDTVNRTWLVGERPTSPDPSWLVTFPQESDVSAAGSGDQPILSRAGFLRWRADARADWEQVDAVNPDPREGDPTRITPAEFELRLCAAPVPGHDDSVGGNEIVAGRENVVRRREYGWYIIPLLLAMLMVESVYASYLSRRPARDTVTVEGASHAS